MVDCIFMISLSLEIRKLALRITTALCQYLQLPVVLARSCSVVYALICVHTQSISLSVVSVSSKCIFSGTDHLQQHGTRVLKLDMWFIELGFGFRALLERCTIAQP